MIDKYYLQLLSSEEIIKYSVKQVVNEKDLQLETFGAVDNECGTCHNKFSHCCGHFGYIQTKMYFLNPFVQKYFEDFIKNYCFICETYNTNTGDLCGNKECRYPQGYKEFSYYESINKKVVQFLQLRRDVVMLLIQRVFRKSVEELMKAFPATQQENQFMVIPNPELLHNYFKNLTGKTIPYLPNVMNAFFLNTVPVCSYGMRIPQKMQQQQNIFNQIYCAIIAADNNININLFRYPQSLFIVAVTKPQIEEIKTFHIAVRIAMNKETAKQQTMSNTRAKMFRQIHLSQNTADPASLMSAAVGKAGNFRQICDAYRVQKSSRTVITPNPYLPSTSIVCPLFIAESITVAVHVCNVNIGECKKYIENFPNYPCALQVQGDKQPVYLNEMNKNKILESLIPGCTIYRQVITGDKCFTNRYPSLREESFSMHTVQVLNTKSIQLPLQIVRKFGADFDGDEMQLLFVTTLYDVIEGIMLDSVQRQLISYDFGTSLIGGAPDLAGGMFQINANKERRDEFIHMLKDMFAEHGKVLPNYNDGQTIIRDGEIVKFSEAVADYQSKFVAFIGFYYGEWFAIKMLDKIITWAYRVNEIAGSSIDPCVIVNVTPKVKEFSYQRLTNIQNAIHDYYTTDHTVNTTSCMQQQTLDELIQSTVNDKYVLLQKDEMIKNITNDKKSYHNKMCVKNTDVLLFAYNELGQVLNEGGVIIYHKYRTSPTFHKFQPTPQSLGYITGSYNKGLTQTEMYFHCCEGRKQLFDKSTSVAKDGYVSRQLSKGLENIVTAFNGLILGDQQSVISLCYGSANYDSRCFIKLPFKFHLMKDEEIRERFQHHPLLDDMLDIIHDIQMLDARLRVASIYYQGFDFICVPFIFMCKSVSLSAINMLWRCRLTSKMTKNFVEIIHNQVMQFYIYILFFCDIDETSTYNIAEDYLRAMVNPGEMVGFKASLASTQIYVQNTLKSIHKKRGEKINQVAGGERFMEIVTNKKSQTIFHTTLLGMAAYDEEKTRQFIQQHQTYNLSILQPQYRILQCGALYMMEIKITYDVLAQNDIDIQYLIMTYLKKEKDFHINIKHDDVCMTIVCMHRKEPCTLSRLWNFKQTEQRVGPQFLYNMFYKLVGGRYYIIGQFSPILKKQKTSDFQRLLTIQGIDQGKTFCSSSYEYQQIQGIVKCHTSVYNELCQNLSQFDGTKEVQQTHVKIIADALTQSGKYSKLSRNNYQESCYKDPNSQIVFEQGNKTIEKECIQQNEYSSKTLLNGALYGNVRPLAGTTFTKIVVDKGMFAEYNKEKLFNVIKDMIVDV